MIINLTILLLFSLSYSQPDTLWTKVFESEESGISYELLALRNGNIYIDIEYENYNLQEIPLYTYQDYASFEFSITEIDDYNLLFSCFELAEYYLTNLDGGLCTIDYPYCEYVTYSGESIYDYNLEDPEDIAYVYISGTKNCSLIRNYDIVSINLSNGQIYSTQHNGLSLEEFNNCMSENEEYNDLNLCIPNIHYISQSNGWNSGGTMLGSTQDYDGDNSFWINHQGSSYICPNPSGYTPALVQNIHWQGGGGIVVASRYSMARYSLGSGNCSLNWETEYGFEDIVGVFSIAELYGLSYGVVGDIGSWNDGYHSFYSRISPDGEIYNETIIGEGEPPNIANGGRVIKGVYYDYTDFEELNGVYVSSIEASSDFSIKKSLFSKITIEGEIIFEHEIDSIYIRDFLITKNGGYLISARNGFNGGEYIFKYNSLFEKEWEINLETIIGMELYSSASGDFKIVEYDNQYIILSQSADMDNSIVIALEEEMYGCTDPEACNYDETANVDDGSCEYEIDCAGDCGGIQIPIFSCLDGDLVCSPDDCESDWDCGEGSIDIEGECYSQQDLDFLQDCIDNSSETINWSMDVNNNEIIEPLELGQQIWTDGRLTELRAKWNPGGGWVYAGLSGEIPLSIGNLTELIYLTFGGNELSGSIPPQISSLINLSYLSLWNNQISGEIPLEIGNLQNLTELYLNTNQLTGTIPSTIEGLTNLIVLALNSNQLTGEIPSWIGNMSNLSYLWLHFNELSGEIPESILNQINLIHLLLASNNLSGEISESIGNLTNLTKLNLDNNEFSGEIPESIGNLINLEKLTLQNNYLISVHENICNLTNLEWSLEINNYSYSHIYNNKLCPPYPECISEYIGEQDTSECIEDVIGCTDPDSCNYNSEATVDDGSCEYCAGGCEGEVTISNLWSDEYRYDFAYTLGELTYYEDQPLKQIAQKEITSLIVTCQETGQIWSFESDMIAGGNGNHNFSFLQERYEDFALPVRNITNGVLIGIDTYATGNYHSLWFSVTAIDDMGNEFTHDNYVDSNPYGWNSSNEIIFPGLYFTGVVDYANLDVLYAEGSFPVADLTYQIGGDGYSDGFACDENCDGSLNGSDCENSISIELHEGSNLISFSLLPDDNSVGNVLTGDYISAIAGEGQAALNTDMGWVGSLTIILYESGYWLLLDDPGSLNLTGIPIQPDQQYVLHIGNNLISYPLSDCGNINEVLSEDDQECIYAIAGEGVAILNTANGWVGSLTELCPNEGYWFVNICDELVFTFDEPRGLTRNLPIQNSSYLYNQSSMQAFYFIENVEGIEIGNWLFSFNGDKVIGARQWLGGMIDVPVMGNDGTDYTVGYIEFGSTPKFKVLKDAEFIDLEGSIPDWSDNGFFVISNLTEAKALPKTFSLGSVFPNPFNPTTTINYSLSTEAKVILEIYDIDGRYIKELKNNIMKAGYHSIVWNADDNASGLYFVKMVVGEYMDTHKLILVK